MESSLTIVELAIYVRASFLLFILLCPFFILSENSFVSVHIPINQALTHINLSIIRLAYIRQMERLEHPILDVGDKHSRTDDQMSQTIDGLSDMSEQMTGEWSKTIPMESTIVCIHVLHDRIGH